MSKVISHKLHDIADRIEKSLSPGADLSRTHDAISDLRQYARELTQFERSNERRVQRIRLSIYNHPVKHDGTIIEFSPDGKWFVVEFDGPMPTTKFWWYRESPCHVADKEPNHSSNDDLLVPGTRIWEVLQSIPQHW